MFAYCNNNPIFYVDNTGTSLSTIFATCYSYDGYSHTYGIGEGQAITVTRNNNSIYIEAYMTFSGEVDPEFLVQGIKNYWEGTYSYGNETVNVYVNIYYGESINGNTITVQTYSSHGRSYCTINVFRWKKTKESTITLYEDYYRYVAGDWSIAHEFGHCLGVYDYYVYDYLPGFDHSFQSIMNIPGVHACDSDLLKVLFAFTGNSYERWYCEGGL